MLLSVVIPCYNEEENVSLFYKTIVDVFGPLMRKTELVFVNDGSTDKTYEQLQKIYAKSPYRIKVVSFSRNFGKEAALLAGLRNAEGVGHTSRLARRVEAATGIETRATILGHIQRGGAPTARDRVVAATMGGYAIDLLHRGETNRVISIKNGVFTDFDIDEGLAMEKTIDEYQFLISRLMSMY